MTIREIRTFNSKIRKLERLSEQYLNSKIKIEIENKRLKQKLKNTRKALEIAVVALEDYEDRDSYDCNGDWCGCEHSTAHEALEQITALEQKDVK